MNALNTYIEEGQTYMDSQQKEINMYADITEVNNNYISPKEEAAGVEDLLNVFGAMGQAAPKKVQATSTETTSQRGVAPSYRAVLQAGWSDATNWWLCLIAFLLFLQICLHE